MATTITDDCINCGACEPECPNNAISQGEPIYVIDPLLCTECVGFHDYEACAAVCPVDCCVTDPNNVETEEVLIARARALHPEIAFGANSPSRFQKTDAGTSTGDVGIAAQPGVSTAAADEALAATAKPIASVVVAHVESQTTTPQFAPPGKEEPGDEKAAATEEAGAQTSAVKATGEERPPRTSEPAPVAHSVANMAPQADGRQAAPQAKVERTDAKPATVEPGVKQPGTPKAAAGKVSAAPSKAVVAESTATQPSASESQPQTTAKKTFANELPVSFAEAERQFSKAGEPLTSGIGRWVILVLQPALGSLSHAFKNRLETAVQNHLFFSTAGSTGLNILGNMILYPIIGMVLAAVLIGPGVIFDKEVNVFLLAGMIVALVEGVFRLREGIFSVKPPEEMKFPAAIYGALLGKLLEPVLAKQTGLIRDQPVPVDGFYSKGFVDKLERERRYGNVYTVEDRGGAFLLRLEFPRWVPDIGLSARSQVPDVMPDYDYDLTLKDGQFVVKGKCTDEKVRKISSSVGAFPPEFTTVIPLREKVVGFAHQCKNKLLEVFLVKEKGYR